MAFQIAGGEGDAPLALGGKRAADDEMDITPMIDIVFLLLIFFVVCSKMDPAKTGAIPEAERGGSVSSNDAVVIIMERGSEDKAKVKRHDGTDFIDDEVQQEIDIGEYVRLQLEAGKKDVLIIGSRNVPVGEVSRVQRAIAEAYDDPERTPHIAVKQM